jgi:hypothetical protein
VDEKIKPLVEAATIKVNNPIVISDGRIVRDNCEEGVSLSKFHDLILEKCIEVCQLHYANAVGSHASAHNSAIKKCIESIKELKVTNDH